jgi:hypothetical protein
MGSLGVIGAQSLDGGCFSVCNADNFGLARLQINLKRDLVQLAIAIKIVCLRGQFPSFKRAGILVQRAGIAAGHHDLARIEFGIDAFYLHDANNDVLLRSWVIGRISN